MDCIGYKNEGMYERAAFTELTWQIFIHASLSSDIRCYNTYVQ